MKAAMNHGLVDDMVHVLKSQLATQVTLYTVTATHCNTLQHTATHCNSLQHTATHRNTLQLYTQQLGGLSRSVGNHPCESCHEPHARRRRVRHFQKPACYAIYYVYTFCEDSSLARSVGNCLCESCCESRMYIYIYTYMYIYIYI